MKIKIAFLVPEIKNCGPINVVFSIIQNLDLTQFEIMLISVRNNNSDYKDIVKDRCVLGFYSLENHSLEELTQNIDVVHSHGYYPDKLLANLKNKSIKKITTIHCDFFKDYLQEYGVIKGFIGAISHFYYLNKGNFNNYVSCSSSTKKTLDKFLIKKNKSNSVSINNGVNQNIFYPLNNEDKMNQRELLGFNLNDKIFIFAGRLIRRKRVPELISFFEQKVKDKGILLILGKGEEFEKCKTIATKNIIFLGHKDNPEKYYQIADYTVSMSNSEGFPMSILEAVSCGCYAFLSDIPSHREFIEKNPNNADFIKNISLNNHYKESNPNLGKLSSVRMTELYTKLYLKK